MVLRTFQLECDAGAAMLKTHSILPTRMAGTVLRIQHAAKWHMEIIDLGLTVRFFYGTPATLSRCSNR